MHWAGSGAINKYIVNMLNASLILNMRIDSKNRIVLTPHLSVAIDRNESSWTNRISISHWWVWQCSFDVNLPLLGNIVGPTTNWQYYRIDESITIYHFPIFFGGRYHTSGWHKLRTDIEKGKKDWSAVSMIVAKVAIKAHHKFGKIYLICIAVKR